MRPRHLGTVPTLVAVPTLALVEELIARGARPWRAGYKGSIDHLSLAACLFADDGRARTRLHVLRARRDGIREAIERRIEQRAQARGGSR